jgi:hypothetical protein
VREPAQDRKTELASRVQTRGEQQVSNVSNGSLARNFGFGWMSELMHITN